MLSDRSRLGEESRDDGLEENDRGEMERACRLPLPSSGKKEEKCVTKIVVKKHDNPQNHHFCKAAMVTMFGV